MSFYPLFIVTYDRGLHWETQKPKPYHWAFFIMTQSIGHQMLGTAHQLLGMPGAFYYSGPGEMDTQKSGSKKLDLEIGLIEAGRMDRVTEILQNVFIESDEASLWNCQDWSLAALEVLRKEGFIDDQYTNEGIKHWLREDQ